MRNPPDCDRAALGAEVLEERHPSSYFGSRRPSIAPRLGWTVRMRRDDVPEQHVALQTEFGEHAMHDRRGGLGWARAGELTLRRERHAADAGAAKACGLADQQPP